MAAPERIEPREFLAKQKHIVLAVVDEDGRPWAVPVAMQHYRKGKLEWISKTDTIHSRAIAANSDIAITCFVARRDGENEYGLYLRAKAKKLAPLPGGAAIYRAEITEAWYNDHAHKKTRIDTASM